MAQINLQTNDQDAFARFFASYSSIDLDLAVVLRRLIRAAIPDASETLDEPGRVVGYAVGAGYSGLVCTIIFGKTGLKRGIVRGAGLSDPQGLLEGTGKRHRYVLFHALPDFDREGIAELIKAARIAAHPEGNA